MRLLLGTLILLTCFVAAALWQRSWTSPSHSNREPFPTSAEGRDPAQPADGWSRVVLGRPSGGEPFSASAEVDSPGSPSHEPESTPLLPNSSTPAEDPGAVPESKEELSAPVTEVIVQRGQTLSEICRERYGTAPLDLVFALARYNKLGGADEIREGQRILLPSPENLIQVR